MATTVLDDVRKDLTAIDQILVDAHAIADGYAKVILQSSNLNNVEPTPPTAADVLEDPLDVHEG